MSRMKITMYELYEKIYDKNPPKHIKVYDEDWYWNDYDGYVTKESLNTTFDAQIYLMDRYRTFMNLDKEVEILDEEGKIEYLDDFCDSIPDCSAIGFRRSYSSRLKKSTWRPSIELP